MKQVERRFWHKGYNKREWGISPAREIALGSQLLGYGVALFLVGKIHRINIYKIVK